MYFSIFHDQIYKQLWGEGYAVSFLFELGFYFGAKIN